MSDYQQEDPKPEVEAGPLGQCEKASKVIPDMDPGTAMLLLHVVETKILCVQLDRQLGQTLQELGELRREIGCTHGHSAHAVVLLDDIRKDQMDQTDPAAKRLGILADELQTTADRLANIAYSQ